MKEKIYIIFKNNEEEYDDYSDWIIEIYKDKEKAEKRFVELVKTNQYKKDRAIKSAKYNEDIGAYRIEEHEIESEESEAMSEEEKEAKESIEYLKTRLYGNEGCKYIDVAQEDLRIFINLVDRKEKDIEGWKKYSDEQEKNIIKKNNIICNLEFQIEKLQKENEELKGTLRDTQNSWFEDTKKMEKLKNQNQCYINSIQSIAPVLIQEYIEKQEIKDKIGDLADTANKINDEIVEELKSKDICQEYLEDKRKELGLINRDIKTLQSLLDESEEK